MYCKTYDQYNVWYEVHGNLQSAETLILLNGLTQSTVSWGFMVPAFAEDFRIILMDFIFQGQSDKHAPWRDFDHHAADVIAVLDACGTSKVHVAGISYGSLVAQHFAVLYPHRVKKMALLATFAHKSPYFEAIEYSWWRALEQGGYHLMLDIMLPSVLSENYFSDPVIPLETMKEMRKGLNQNSDALFKLMRATKERKDYRKELQAIKCPVLLIHGEKDVLVPLSLAREVLNNLESARLEVVRNAGHTLNLESVYEVSRLMFDFFRSQ